MRLTAMLAALGMAATGCWDGDEVGDGAAFDVEPRDVAGAVVEPRSGNTSLYGFATAIETRDTVTLSLTVTGAPPGRHGVHLHAVGDCSAADASSAGDHWNPEEHPH